LDASDETEALVHSKSDSPEFVLAIFELRILGEPMTKNWRAEVQTQYEA